MPKPTGARTKVHLAGLERPLERLSIRKGSHEHRSGNGVLDHDRNQTPALREIERGDVDRTSVMHQESAPVFPTRMQATERRAAHGGCQRAPHWLPLPRFRME